MHVLHTHTYTKEFNPKEFDAIQTKNEENSP